MGAEQFRTVAAQDPQRDAIMLDDAPFGVDAENEASWTCGPTGGGTGSRTVT